MSNIIDKIRLSGTDYTLSATSSGGNPTVELTQAEYDALVSAGTVSADTYYIITDAQAGDLTQYWTSAQTQSAITQATSGKADSSAVTEEISAAVSGKQDTLVSGTNIKTINNESLLGSGNIDIQGGGGGGKAIEAGRGISVTTGETADTVNCTLPISASTGAYSVMFGQPTSTSDASGSKTITGGQWSKAFSEGAVSIGQMNEARGQWAWAIGNSTKTDGKASFACGDHTLANYNYAFSEGTYTTANTQASHAAGSYTSTKNRSEFSIGQYNNSVSASTTWGDSGNTLFSVGNGTANNARHNAFEVRQNGDIYISSGGTDIKLQDHLGGGGGGGSYTPGDGIDITNNVISVTGKVATSAVTTALTSSSTDSEIPSAKAVYDQVGGLKLVKLSQSAYDALSPNYDSNTLYVING